MQALDYKVWPYRWLAVVSTLLTLFCAVVPTAASAADADKRGAVVALGGAVRGDNAAIWSRLVALAGGSDGRWLIIPAASGEPARAAKQILDSLAAHGAKGAHNEMLPLSTRLPGVNVRDAVRDPALIEKVNAASAIYFTGGAQERISAALLDDRQQPTPLLEAIWRLLARGGVVAGSSAGAAIMSETMFREPPEILDVMRVGAARGSHIDRGLGFVGPGVFVDQHFVARGRLGRMLAVMAQENIPLGIGVEENSAAVFQGGKVEVIGARGVMVANLKPAKRVDVKPLHLGGAEVSWLEAGDSLDLVSLAVTPATAKRAGKRLDWRAPDFSPYNKGVRFMPDMLGDGVVVNAMTTLVDSEARELRGLAFALPTGAPSGAGQGKTASSLSAIGFEYRFYKTPDTLGYFVSASGAEQTTVIRMGLDVVPVKLAEPLYSPYAKPAAKPDLNPTAVRPEPSAKAGENAPSRELPRPETAK